MAFVYNDLQKEAIIGALMFLRSTRIIANVESNIHYGFKI